MAILFKLWKQPHPLEEPVVADASPVSAIIPFCIGQMSSWPATATRYPSFADYTTVQPPATPVIPFLNRDLWELREPIRLVLPQFFPLVPFVETVVTVPPVIAFRYGQDVLRGTAGLVPSQYQAFPYFEQPANPVPPIRQADTVQEVPAALVRPQVFTFPFVSAQAPATANPVPPIRQADIVSDGPVALVRPQYFSFPAFPQVNVLPAMRMRRLEELGQPVQPTRSGYFTFPYFQTPPAPANPVIALRVGQWVSDQVQPLVGIHGYFEFPWVSTLIAPSNPVIPFRARDLEELREPTRLVQPSYFTFPYFKPLPAPIPMLRGQWMGDAVVSRPVQPSRFWFPTAPLPANAVIPYVKGQWIGDVVRPLIGIHGYYEFPWHSNVPSVGEPYWRADVAGREMTFDPTDRVLTFPAKTRRYLMDN